MNLKFKKTLKKNPMASGAECIQQVQSLLPGTLENRETEVDVVLRSLLMRLLHIDAFCSAFPSLCLLHGCAVFVWPVKERWDRGSEAPV